MGVLTEHANAILWAEDLPSARAAFRRGVTAAGVEMYAYGNFRRGVELGYVDTTYPAAWVDRYLSNNYQLIDPVVIESRRTHLPFAWRYALQRAGGLTPEQQGLFGEAAEHGIRDGYTIPFHSIAGCSATMSFAFGSTERMREVVGGSSKLRLLAIYYHNAVERLLATGLADEMLSSVERQCLSFAAEGQTLWQISASTRRPESDVAQALRNAREKLGATTTAQAASKARDMGLLAAAE